MDIQWIKGDHGFNFGSVIPNAGKTAPQAVISLSPASQDVSIGIGAPESVTAPAKDRAFPDIAGFESNNGLLFIGRAEHEGGIHPGKIYIGTNLQGKLSCFVSYGGREFSKENFEYCTGSLRWVKTSGNGIPPNAVQTGKESGKNGSHPLYTGRAWHNGMLIIGKAGSHLGSGLHIPYAGKELIVHDYEILAGKG